VQQRVQPLLAPGARAGEPRREGLRAPPPRLAPRRRRGRQRRRRRRRKETRVAARKGRHQRRCNQSNQDNVGGGDRAAAAYPRLPLLPLPKVAEAEGVTELTREPPWQQTQARRLEVQGF
jgi:hypothetical protein